MTYRVGLGRTPTGLLVGLLVGLVALGGAVLSAGPQPLRASGPTAVSGTTASAAFTIGHATVRQVRYVDRRQLRYTFTLRNTSGVPLWLDGPAPSAGPTMLRPRGLEGASGRMGADETRRVTVRLLMTGCERLSARAASVVSDLRLKVRVLGLAPRVVRVELPERLRAGSPRELNCPAATSASRPRG